MDKLINMNRRLRIGIFSSSFVILILAGIIIDSIFVVGLGFVTLAILVYTNMKYDDIHNKKLSNSLKESLEEYNFNYTDSYITQDFLSGIAINTENEKVAILTRHNNKSKFQLDEINFSDILESKVIEDNITVTKSSKGGLIGGAAVGSMVAGGVGAIIGGLSGNKVSRDSVLSMTLEIVVNDLSNPLHEIKFLYSPTPIKKDTVFYKQIHSDINKWHKTITVIMKRNEINKI